MALKKFVFVGGLGMACSLLVGSLVSCLDDPRASDVVHVIDTCDVNQLSTDPSSPEATLRTYLESTELLLQRATEVEGDLRDACNAMATDLGLPTGTDALTACKAIGARITALAKAGVAPPPGFPYWAEFRAAPNCTPQPNVLEQCVAACAGPCDATKCEPSKLAGKCAGECKGECVTKGDDIPCNGKCVGEAPNPGAPTTCLGECEGICTGPTWSGECAGACATFFLGSCGGTCTGTCDGVPINTDALPPPPDPDDDAGAPPPGPPMPPPPPANADGNCQGFCQGVCSSQAVGFCNGIPCMDFSQAPPDLAPFKGGNCASGQCAGTCRSAFGTGTLLTCNGECTEANRAECGGLCRGECVGERTETSCEGTLDCGQNIECENACQARVLLATTCEDSKVFEAYAITDPALGEAMRTHGPKFGKAVSQLNTLRAAFGYIGDRAYGDFVAIGLRGDLTRACVAKGNENVAAADAKITAAVAADPSIRTFQ